MQRAIAFCISLTVAAASLMHAAVTSFTALPRSAPEVGNPMRGLYGWGGNGTNALVTAPLMDCYRRFNWNELESAVTPGVYDFTAIDDCIRTASNRGACFGFRVRCYVPGSGILCGVPAYITNTAGGFRDADGIYVPDWNNPYFLARADSIIEALASRFDRHPYVSFVDIGIYGMWGEWHMSGFPYPGPAGEQRITSNNACRIIDTYARCFTNTWLVFRVNNEYTRYAMDRYPRMGCRADSVANPGFDIERSKTPWMNDRWKRAPFIGETWSPLDPATSVHLAADDITNHHLTMLGNGNLELTTTAATNAFISAGKLLGHRFEAVSVAVPSVITQCAVLPVTSLWRNSGVAPAYVPWILTWRLRAADGSTAFTCTSSLDLRRLLPTVSLPVCIRDRAAIPATVPPGEYSLEFVITDMRGVRRPLALAITAPPLADGGYRTGTVRILPFTGSAAERTAAYARSVSEALDAASRYAVLQENAVAAYPAAGGTLFEIPDPFDPDSITAANTERTVTDGGLDNAAALYTGHGSAVTFINIPGDTDGFIYTVSGRLAAKLPRQDGAPLAWDLSGTDGRRVVPGVYVCLLRSNAGSRTIKVLVGRR